jgi:hypothetical protein
LKKNQERKNNEKNDEKFINIKFKKLITALLIVIFFIACGGDGCGAQIVISIIKIKI